MKHFIKVIGNIDYLRVRHEHGEQFVRACLDEGNSPATTNKKLRLLKRLFEMALERGQLDENPLRKVRNPKVAKNRIRIFTEHECQRLIKAAACTRIGHPIRWDLLIATALGTGMRRGELLNSTWMDIDFDKKVVHVSPKKGTTHT
jgi:site-specific recombinase XerD